MRISHNLMNPILFMNIIMKKREEKISLKFWSPLRPVGQAILVSVNLVCSSKYIYGSDETVQIRKMV